MLGMPTVGWRGAVRAGGYSRPRHPRGVGQEALHLLNRRNWGADAGLGPAERGERRTPIPRQEEPREVVAEAAPRRGGRIRCAQL